MKRSWKRTRIWRRLVSGLLTAVMLVTMLPTAAYAALLDNTPDQNRQILEELTAFWGDEKTAQEAMELLRQYGLIDEEGNILTDWSGKISIQEESRPLTIGQARAMSEGDVTVNGRACGLAELNAVLDGMERLGLLVDDVPVAHWQLQVNGQSVAERAANRRAAPSQRSAMVSVSVKSRSVTRSSPTSRMASHASAVVRQMMPPYQRFWARLEGKRMK